MPKTSITLTRRVDDLDHHDGLVARNLATPQRTVAFVMIQPRGAGVAHEGRGAMDFIAMAIALDHDAADFGIRFSIDMRGRDPIRPDDDEARHTNAVPEIQVLDIAFECGMSVVMQPPPSP